MSEVKLYVPTVNIVFDDIFQRDMEVHGTRPATTAEIMEAHPECWQCKNWSALEDSAKAGWCYLFSEEWDLDDYCSHWEAKE